MCDLSLQEKVSIILPVVCNMDASDGALEGYILLGRVYTDTERQSGCE